jgi:nitrogen fixation protein FixH
VVLALGWAVDGLAQLAPAAHFTNGQTQQAGLYRVALALDPAQPHASAAERFTLHVTDVSGHAVSTADVRLTLAMPSMEMPPLQLTAAANGKGDYSATSGFAMRGAWVVTARVSPPGGSAVHTDFDIAVR